MPADKVPDPYEQGFKTGKLAALRQVLEEFNDRANVIHAAYTLCETVHGKQRADEGEIQVRWCAQRIETIIKSEGG